MGDGNPGHVEECSEMEVPTSSFHFRLCREDSYLGVLFPSPLYPIKQANELIGALPSQLWKERQDQRGEDGNCEIGWGSWGKPNLSSTEKLKHPEDDGLSPPLSGPA